VTDRFEVVVMQVEQHRAPRTVVLERVGLHSLRLTVTGMAPAGGTIYLHDLELRDDDPAVELLLAVLSPAPAPPLGRG
jgi:hypothetical protein